MRILKKRRDRGRNLTVDREKTVRSTWVEVFDREKSNDPKKLGRIKRPWQRKFKMFLNTTVIDSFAGRKKREAERQKVIQTFELKQPVTS